MKNFLFIFALLGSSICIAQISDPVTLNYSVKQVDKETVEVVIDATIEQPWHIYSQYTEEGGPLPTTFNFIENPGVKIKGRAKEIGDLVEKYEDVFMVNTRYYSNKVTFVQEVKLKEKNPNPLKGSITYMACTDEQCLIPTEIEFQIDLTKTELTK